ncbi:MAG: nucleotidyltransferase family protein [Patescibacteria group bacterium]|mgnify:CR=1 FL=1
MRAVILAGGFGTRLHPVTLEIPKPLLTVQHRPILNHLVDFFVKHGINEPTILINKNHRQDYHWWRKRYSSELPKKLSLKVEPKPLGTFGGLKYLKNQLTTTFVLSNGDELKDFDLRAMMSFHRRQKSLATIALVKVENPSDYGVPVMKGSKIREFLEKPANPPSKYISSGLYILEPEVLDRADWKKGFLMVEKDIFPRLAEEGKLAGYKIKNGKWYDCGTFERWEKAIKEW